MQELEVSFKKQVEGLARVGAGGRVGVEGWARPDYVVVVGERGEEEAEEETCRCVGGGEKR